MIKHLFIAAAIACPPAAGAYLILVEPDEVTVEQPTEALAFSDEVATTTTVKSLLDDATPKTASEPNGRSPTSTSTTRTPSTTSTTTTAPSSTTTSTTTAAPTTTRAPTTTPAPTTAAPATTAAAPATTAAPTTTAAPATTAAPTTTAAPSGNAVQQAAAESLARLNATRASVGLGPLTLDPAMSAFAIDWSNEMNVSGFRHSSGPYGENIAWHSNGNMSPVQAATHFNNAWVNSPGHFANMTSGRYTHVGIGLVPHGSGWWATHVFR